MKYYIKTDNSFIIEDEPHKVVVGVDANLWGRGCMRVNEWGRGYIIEADEGLDLWLMIRWGHRIVKMQDEEVRLLMNDKVLFFSKARTLELREVINFPNQRGWDLTKK